MIVFCFKYDVTSQGETSFFFCNSLIYGQHIFKDGRASEMRVIAFLFWLIYLKLKVFLSSLYKRLISYTKYMV